ncbi:MAG: hypothetical protein KDD53_04470, partial [Bdellovibrionales bacterium]|nr:hypothetical protein [Bdellovibrionales bacterium]
PPSGLQRLSRILRLLNKITERKVHYRVTTRFPEFSGEVVRELSEGLYAGLETPTSTEVGSRSWRSERVVTERATRALALAGFARAKTYYPGRRVVVACKPNILQADGLFWAVCQEVAMTEFPELEVVQLHFDACLEQVVRFPEQFGVVITENYNGDALSDLFAGMTGGIGLAPGINVNTETGFALAEPVGGTAPVIAGKGTANPTAAILSGALLLEHMGEVDSALRIREGVRTVLSRAEVRTSDLGGTSSTAAFTDAVIRALPQPEAAS